MEPKKPTWIEKAKETHRFHREKLRSHDKWTVTETAKSLRRSFGSVVEDLLIARWLKTHEKQIEKFDYAYQALEFIRKKKNEMETEEID